MADLSSSSSKVHPNQIQDWKKKLCAGCRACVQAPRAGRGSSIPTQETQQLHAKIGQLTMEKRFLSKVARSMTGASERGRAMATRAATRETVTLTHAMLLDVRRGPTVYAALAHRGSARS